MSKVWNWVVDFPYHPIILLILILAEVLFWLGIGSFTYNWWKGTPLEFTRLEISELAIHETGEDE